MYYFYIIVSLGGRVGFGITKNPPERNQQYCSHAGGIVKFVLLYGGIRAHAKALERTIKTQYIDNLWLVGDWKTEWLNENVTAATLQAYVDDLIATRHMNLKLVATEYDFTQGEVK
jgi:hypothetical protein